MMMVGVCNTDLVVSIRFVNDYLQRVYWSFRVYGKTVLAELAMKKINNFGH